LAAELVRLKPDVLVTHGVPGTLAAKRATNTIPIVIGVVGEAVAIGAVEGLARPGGNVTGSSFFVPELNAKRLEVLKEAFPRLSRVGVLLNRDNAVNMHVLKAMEQTAQALKIQLQSVEARGPGTSRTPCRLSSRDTRVRSRSKTMRCCSPTPSGSQTGQDPQGRQACRLAHRAADELVRVVALG
jgi:ABC transporter substrate binding protein